MLRTFFRRCIYAIIPVVAILVFLSYLYLKPQSTISIFLFKNAYQMVDDKRNFLYAYSPRRRDVNALYLPSEVDDFLCEQAENTTDESELDAIVNLYILQAGGGRDGDCIFKTSDTTRRKIAEIVVEKLHHPDDLGVVYHSVVLLEEVRIGRSLEKSYFGPSPLAEGRPTSRDEEKRWMEEIGLPTAAEAYVTWWRSPTTWNEKKATNPLSGKAIEVINCCG